MIRAVEIARAQIGTPFRHQGRTPGWALDCAGLVVHVAAELGLEYFDQQGYSRHPSDNLLESALDGQPCLRRVALDDMQPGDVLVMRFSGDPQHLAIYAGFNTDYQADGIVHALCQTGKSNSKVCEHRLDDDWRSRIVRVYRFTEAA